MSLGFVACGGSNSPSPTEAPITLSSTGLSTSAVIIPTGGRVHFFNIDTLNHQMTSPNCPDLDTPVLSPGGDSLRPILTGPLSCTFTDALTSAGTFDGTVTVNSPGTPGGGAGY